MTKAKGGSVWAISRLQNAQPDSEGVMGSRSSVGQLSVVAGTFAAQQLRLAGLIVAAPWGVWHCASIAACVAHSPGTKARAEAKR